MAWEYQREESKNFAPIPEGDYRIRIKSAEKAVSKNSGNDMIALQFEVSGKSSLLFHYIVFLPDRRDVTNRMLTQFFDSFAGIPDGDFNLDLWAGQVGACHVKHEEYNGETRAKLHYFISADKARDLPAWVEPDRKPKDSAPAAPAKDTGFVEVDTSTLPFI